MHETNLLRAGAAMLDITLRGTHLAGSELASVGYLPTREAYAEADTRPTKTYLLGKARPRQPRNSGRAGSDAGTRAVCMKAGSLTCGS